MYKQDLVILHGWNSKISQWRESVNALSKYFNVYLPAIPGFGSNKLKKAWDINDYCIWFNNYLKFKKIKKPIIVAHSFGGQIAVFYSSKNQNVSKLVLISSAGIRNKIEFKKTFFWLIAKVGKILFSVPALKKFSAKARSVLYYIAGEHDYYDANGFLKKTFQNILKQDFRPNLKRINVPTLIIWGELDDSTPLNDAYLIKKNIKGARLDILSNSGHDIPFSRTNVIISKIIKFANDGNS